MAAKAKHHAAWSVLENFSACEPKKMQETQKVRRAKWIIVLQSSLDSWFMAVKKPKSSRLFNDHIICTVGEINELKELTGFKFGCLPTASLVERCVLSFHDFMVFL